MSKYNMTGFFLWFVSLILLVFQYLSSLINKENILLSFATIIDSQHFNWIDQISAMAIQKGLHYFITMPLFIIIFTVGLILILIDGVFNIR